MQHLHLCRLRQWRGEGQKRLASEQSNEHTKLNSPLPEFVWPWASIARCYNYPICPILHSIGSLINLTTVNCRMFCMSPQGSGFTCDPEKRSVAILKRSNDLSSLADKGLGEGRGCVGFKLPMYTGGVEDDLCERLCHTRTGRDATNCRACNKHHKFTCDP